MRSKRQKRAGQTTDSIHTEQKNTGNQIGPEGGIGYPFERKSEAAAAGICHKHQPDRNSPDPDQYLQDAECGYNGLFIYGNHELRHVQPPSRLIAS